MLVCILIWVINNVILFYTCKTSCINFETKLDRINIAYWSASIAHPTDKRLSTALVVVSSDWAVFIISACNQPQQHSDSQRPNRSMSMDSQKGVQSLLQSSIRSKTVCIGIVRILFIAFVHAAQANKQGSYVFNWHNFHYCTGVCRLLAR